VVGFVKVLGVCFSDCWQSWWIETGAGGYGDLIMVRIGGIAVGFEDKERASRVKVAVEDRMEREWVVEWW
jgi:hypothetical protein